MNKKEAIKILNEKQAILSHTGPPYAHRHPFEKGMEHINKMVKEWREAEWALGLEEDES